MTALSQRIREVLQSGVNAPNGPAGLVYGALDRDGKLLVLEAAGVRKLDTEEKMTTDSLFPLFSTNKAIVAVAALQLVDGGKITLDEPVKKFCPEIERCQVLQDDGSLKPAQRDITLRMLLTHTSGCAYSLFNEKLTKYIGDGPRDLDPGFDRWNMPLVFEPGTAWQYGTSIDWTARFVERVVGVPFWDYVEEEVLKPLDIHDTGFHIHPHVKDRLVGLHERRPDGTVHLRDLLPYQQFMLNSGQGTYAAFGTAPDYLKFLHIFLNGGKGANGHRVLSKEMTKEALRDQLLDLGISIPDVVKTHGDWVTNDVDLTPGSSRGWSLIAMVDRDSNSSGRSAGSNWWAGLANLYYTVDDTTGLATVLMSQSLPFWDKEVLAVREEAEREVYRALAAPVYV